MASQREWPAVKREPVGHYQTPDGTLRSDRSVAGPLRLGTAPGVGPKGFLRDGNASDFGMDRVSPRGFDPMGTSDTRAPAQEGSSLLSRETRAKRDE
jgi:hypothetical protein